MTVTIKDAIVFFKDAEAHPIIGSISYEKPVKPDTALIISDGSKTVITTIKQIRLAIFKRDNKFFGFILKEHACYIASRFSFWYKETAKYAGRKLHKCFADQ